MAKEDKAVQPFEEIVDENEELGDENDDENNNDQEESDMAKDTKAAKRRREEIEDEEDEDETVDSSEDDDEDEADDESDESEDDDDDDEEVNDEFAQFKPFIVHEEQEWSLEEVLTEATPGEEIYFYVLENNHFYKLAPIKVGEVPGT